MFTFTMQFLRVLQPNDLTAVEIRHIFYLVAADTTTKLALGPGGHISDHHRHLTRHHDTHGCHLVRVRSRPQNQAYEPSENFPDRCRQFTSHD